MQNFSTIQEAEKYVVDYFANHHDYVGEFDYRNIKGIIQFYNVNNLTVCHTFECTIFASEPLKRPVGRPKGREKVYIAFKIEPKYHAEVKAMVKEFISRKTALLLILSLFMASCGSGPVLMQTKKYTYFKGNYAKFENRRINDSIRIAEKILAKSIKLDNFK